MSYCLNPNCSKPQNADGIKVCQSCGSPLLLQKRYQTLKPIGQGGFGRTFLAVDGGKPSKPRCVIKQFFPQNQGRNNADKAAALFRQEAERLKVLGKHPQIPALLAHFEQDGRQYLVQEFIEGQNLAEELAQEGAFNEAQIRELLESLVPVLKFVHEHQVIHRDIKPANIIRRTSPIPPPAPSLLRRGASGMRKIEPKGGQLVLVDFGAAKFTTGTALFRTGTTIGSAEYTAPEQMRGKAVFASDLYSLGVTCIHLLTQIPPFDLFDSTEDAWVWRDFLINPVSEPLAYVLDKLLQSATKRRYHSVAEVLWDLKSPSNHKSTTTVTSPGTPINPGFPSSRDRSVQASPTSQPQIPSWLAEGFLEEHPDQRWSVSPFQMPCDAPLEHIAHPYYSPVSTTPKKLRQTTALRVGFATFMIFMASSAVRYAANNWRSPYTWSDTDPSTSKLAPERSIPEFKETARPRHTLSQSDLVLSVAISPDGQTLVSGSADSQEDKSTEGESPSNASSESKIRVWNLRNGKPLFTLPTQYPVWSVVISPDSKTLVSSTANVSPTAQLAPPADGSDRGSIQIWDLQTGDLLRTIPKSADDGMFIAISPDGKTLASGANEAIKLWDLKTGELIRTLEPQSSGVNSVIFSQDGRVLASTGFDGKIKVWNPRTGELIRTLEGQSGSISSLAISPDGQTLVSGVTNGGSGSISTWDLRTGELINTFTPLDTVASLAISPDGKTLASGSWDSKTGTIRIWNLETGRLLRNMRAHISVVDSLTFSPDGKTLASGSLDQSIKVWRVLP
jgi:WD40 repeat protein